MNVTPLRAAVAHSRPAGLLASSLAIATAFDASEVTPSYVGVAHQGSSNQGRVVTAALAVELQRADHAPSRIETPPAVSAGTPVFQFTPALQGSTNYLVARPAVAVEPAQPVPTSQVLGGYEPVPVVPPAAPAMAILQGATNQGYVLQSVKAHEREQLEPQPETYGQIPSTPPIFQVILQGGTNQGWQYEASVAHTVEPLPQSSFTEGRVVPVVEAATPGGAVAAGNALTVIATHAPINQIANHSFASDTTGWAAISGASIARTSDFAHSGNWSVAVDTPGAGSLEGLQLSTSACPAAAPGEVWTGSAYARGSGTVAVRVRALDAANALIVDAIGSSTALTGSFARLTVTTAALPANTAKVQLFVRTTSTQDVTFWVDACQLEKASAASAYTDTVASGFNASAQVPVTAGGATAGGVTPTESTADAETPLPGGAVAAGVSPSASVAVAQGGATAVGVAATAQAEVAIGGAVAGGVEPAPPLSDTPPPGGAVAGGFPPTSEGGLFTTHEPDSIVLTPITPGSIVFTPAVEEELEFTLHE